MARKVFAQSIFLLFPVLMSACAVWSGSTVTPLVPTETQPQTAVSTLPPLPDLTIPSVELEMRGRHGGCVTAYTPYSIRVTIENIGSADASPFIVQLNQQHQSVKEGLRAGQRIELDFTSLSADGRYVATVDSSNQVAEADEENNTRSYQAPTPTPPPLCTAVPALSSTPSPGG